MSNSSNDTASTVAPTPAPTVTVDTSAMAAQEVLRRSTRQTREQLSLASFFAWTNGSILIALVITVACIYGSFMHKGDNPAFRSWMILAVFLASLAVVALGMTLYFRPVSKLKRMYRKRSRMA